MKTPKKLAKAPRRLWVVLDDDESAADPLLEVHTTRRDARRALVQSNGLPAYEATCRVVGPYVLEVKP